MNLYYIQPMPDSITDLQFNDEPSHRHELSYDEARQIEIDKLNDVIRDIGGIRVADGQVQP